MSPVYPLGRRPFGRDVVGVSTADGGLLTEIVEDLYHLALYDDSNDLVRWLPRWGSGQWTQTVNEPSGLVFTYPYDDEATADIDFPNHVVLLDRARNVVDRLRVVRRDKVRGTDGTRKLVAHCQGFLGQLGKEHLTEYVKSATSIRDIVRDLLDQQTASRYTKLLYGGCDYTATRDVDWRNRTILECLQQLREAVGGLLYVDADRRVYLVEEAESFVGQRIEVGKNLPGLTVETDKEGIYTKVTVIGRGINTETAPQASATNATGTYGTITRVVRRPDIEDSDLLQDIADTLVARWSKPIVRYRCDALDLSQASTDLDYSHEALTLGRIVNLVDDTIDETAQMRIVKVSRDLAVPVGVGIEVQDINDPPDTTRDIIDVIADLHKRVTAQELPADEWISVATEDDLPTPYHAPAIAYVEGTGDYYGYDGVEPGWQSLEKRLRDHLEGAGSEFPFMARIFVQSDLAGVNALAGSGSYPDLAFRNGDFALATSEKVLYKRVSGDWEEVAGLALISAADYASLPTDDIEAGSRAFTTTDRRRWFWDSSIADPNKWRQDGAAYVPATADLPTEGLRGGETAYAQNIGVGNDQWYWYSADEEDWVKGMRL